MSKSAAMALKIEKFQSPGKGNGLRASAVLSPGELLYVAEPFAYVVSQASWGIVCDFCLRKSTPLLRCSRCKFAKYCDKHCQVKAWPDHKQECRCLASVWPEHDEKTHLLRFVGRIILKLLQKKPCPSEDLYSVSELVSNHYNEENKEMRRESESLAEELHVYMRNVIPAPSALLANLNIPEHFSKVFSNQIMIFNNTLEDVAVALYPSMSLLNHNCDPNCAVVFKGKYLYLRATKEVHVGEELTISYDDLLAPTIERQGMLKQTFCFECNCHRCQTFDKDDRMLAGDKQASDETRDLIFELQKRGDCPENWPECLQLCQAQLNKNQNRLPDENIYQLQILGFAMKLCIASKKMTEALHYGLRTLGPYRLYYPGIDIQRAFNMYEVVMVQNILDDKREALGDLREALDIIKVFYGPGHSYAQSLSKMLESCL